MDDNRQPGGVPTVTIEAAVAIALFLFGSLVVYDSMRLGSSWGADGPQSGYFPFYIGLLVCLSSAVTFFQNVLGKNRASGEIFVDRSQFKLVLMVLVPAAVFVLGIQFVGIYVAAAVYVAGFMVVFGKYSWFKASLLAIVNSASLFVMFEVWFKVPLFKGYWNPLGFLGY